MFYRRKGFPQEDEFVLCTVTKIHHNSVFVFLDEYGKYGLIHISEIAPGRIRNIRDYVTKGKKIVCKVLRVNEARGYIDLSLRRVNESQRRAKINEIKQEQRAEKIVELVALRNKLDAQEVYSIIAHKVFEQLGYEFLHEYFQDYVKGVAKLEFALPAKVLDDLKRFIKLRIKLPEVRIKGIISLSFLDPDGLEKVKKSLFEARRVVSNIEIRYLGSGRYSAEIKAPDFKSGEKIFEKAMLEVLSKARSFKGKASYELVK